jgi:hypothetical protein
MEQIKFLTLFDKIEKQSSPSGEHIYEWEYLDEDGKLQKDKKNIFEEIQSYLPRVDYKSQIAKGELEFNDINGSIHTDTRSLPTDSVSLYNYLVNLATLPQEQITNLLEQINVSNQESLQGKQNTNSQTISGGSDSQQNVQNQSTNGKINSDINGGGK